MVTETEQKQIPDLESALQQAVERLTTYVSAVPKDRLRGHQVETLEALLNFLRAGNTAGYINSPTGSGKTYLISELSQILGLKTIVLSPTKTILEHTHGVTTSLTPDADITNYYSGDKKLTGQTINTTYQSLPALLESGLLDPSEIGLLICDEAHMALGEQRHKIYQQIPQALMIGLTATPYFGHLEGYRRRGMISNERWTELFTNQIHEISLEEGMERDILAPADVRLIKTAASVDNISISQGDYNKSQLERHLNIEARNWLTVAMVAGLDKLPEHIQISEEKRAEIESIYQEIKDKNGIAIFGLSIEHVEKLAQMLRNSGILSTFSVHGKTPLYHHVYRIIKEAFAGYSQEEEMKIVRIDPQFLPEEYHPIYDSEDPEEIAIKHDLRDTIDDMLDFPDPRVKEILNLRFGLKFPLGEMTYEEIGKKFGVSKERVRQIERTGFQSLRTRLDKQKLGDDYWETETCGIIAFPSETRSRALIGKSSPISFSPQLINPEFMDLNAQLKFQIKNLEINEESKGILAAAGIKYIWEVFATPPEELFSKTEGGFRYRDSSLSRAAAKLFEAKLDPLYESVIDWHYHSPSEDERELTKMVMMAVYYRDKKLFDVSSFGQKLVNPDQAQDWINSQAFKSDFLLSLNFRREYWKVDQWLIRDNQSKD